MEALLQWLTVNWWIIFLFLLCFGGGIWAGAKQLIQQWHEGKRRQQENALKRDMVAKGFSPADIERVLNASAPPISADSDSPTNALFKYPAKEGEGPGFDKARLVATLVQHGMEAEEIERILQALAEYPDDQMPAKVAAIQSMAEQGMDAKGIERVIRAFHQQVPVAAPRAAGDTAFKE